MTIDLTPQNIITAASFLTAVVLIVKHFANGIRWVDKQNKGLTDYEALKQKHETDMAALKDVLAKDMQDIHTEQTLLTYGVLACLKGQQEQGCNGPVTEAIGKIEKYLNQKAHGSMEAL